MSLPLIIRLCANASDRAAAMRIRFAVFVDEQKVPADEEPDAYDADARHFVAVDNLSGAAVGTLRIVDKGAGIAKIGRVAVLVPHRGTGIGRALMLRALDELQAGGFTTAVLDAQVPVISFYERLGFVAEGPVFDDAGIDHRRMTLLLPFKPENAP